LMGATRRLDHYDASLGWQPLFIVAGIGVLTIGLGIGFQVLQLIVSIRQRKEHIDATGDPWNGRTLEWSLTSPPPEYNFVVLPDGSQRDAFWAAKHSKHDSEESQYISIRVPKNSGLALLIGMSALAGGFGMVWHIWWLASLGLAAIICLVIARTSYDDNERVIPAKQVRLEAETREGAS